MSLNWVGLNPESTSFIVSSGRAAMVGAPTLPEVAALGLWPVGCAGAFADCFGTAPPEQGDHGLWWAPGKVPRLNSIRFHYYESFVSTLFQHFKNMFGFKTICLSSTWLSSRGKCLWNWWCTISNNWLRDQCHWGWWWGGSAKLRRGKTWQGDWWRRGHNHTRRRGCARMRTGRWWWLVGHHEGITAVEGYNQLTSTLRL